MDGDSKPLPDPLDLAQEAGKKLLEVGQQFKESVAELAEEASYRFDKEFARALSKNPELYAELKRTMRQIKKTVDTAMKSLDGKP